MPIYEYRCEKCGDFEVTQRITEDALKKCPTCRRKIHKLISNTSFQLKGSGWYVTDYARAGKDKEKDKGGAKDAKGGEGAAAKSDSAAGGESKTDSKAEPKKEKAKKPSAKAA